MQVKALQICKLSKSCKFSIHAKAPVVRVFIGSEKYFVRLQHAENISQKQ